VDLSERKDGMLKVAKDHPDELIKHNYDLFIMNEDKIKEL